MRFYTLAFVLMLAVPATWQGVPETPAASSTPRSGLAPASQPTPSCESAPQAVTGTVVSASDPRLSRLNGLLLLDDEPLCGVVETTGAEGDLRARTSYRDGKLEGAHEVWCGSDRLREQRFYRAGRKHGIHRGWWEDGTARFVLGFQDGNNDGEHRVWARNGQLVELRNFDRGQEAGPQRSWTATGKALANYVVRDGRRYGLLGAKPCYTVSDGVRRFSNHVEQRRES